MTRNEVSDKQNLINVSIWIVIANVAFVYSSERNTTLMNILWWITSIFLFGSLFALTGVVNKFIKNKIVAFAVSIGGMLVLNFVLLRLFGR